MHKINSILTLICTVFLSAFANAQVHNDSTLWHLLYDNGSDSLRRVLDDSATYQYQIIYTRIDRNARNRPHFTNFMLNVDRNRYFNPASTVKLPVALEALEKIGRLKKQGIDINTSVYIDSAFSGQSIVSNDSSAENRLPSIGNYIKKVFLVSDNDAYNRLYEFTGQRYINRRLWDMGYDDIRITRQFTRMTEKENRHTNPFIFYKGNDTIYRQPADYSTLSFDFSKKILMGKAHYDRDERLVDSPMNFTTHNNFPLQDLHMILRSVLFPKAVPPGKRFRITGDDYRFLYKYMSEMPSESKFPHFDTSEFFDSYAKFFLLRAGRRPLPKGVRIFDKTGWSYGFLTDAAYIVDFKNKTEFMVSAVIYVNSDGVLNDNKYDYEEIGYPFFREVGEILYDYELRRDRRYKPDLSKFSIDYTE